MTATGPSSAEDVGYPAHSRRWYGCSGAFIVCGRAAHWMLTAVAVVHAHGLGVLTAVHCALRSLES